MDISRLADLLRNKASSAAEDYSQLANAYPNLKNFAGALVGNIERNVPTQADLENPEAMQQRAIGYMSPMAGAIKVSHGSPHLFDRFDMSKIGSGEGAQSYGHGLYFAENPNVANEYRFVDAKTNPNETTYNDVSINDLYKRSKEAQSSAYKSKQNEAIDKANAELDFWENLMEGVHPKQYINLINNPEHGWEAQEKFANSLDLNKFGGVDMSPGHLYNVSLKWPDAAREAVDPMSPHHFLDWDKPLSEQSDYVKSLLKNSDYEYGQLLGGGKIFNTESPVRAGSAYQDLKHKLTPSGHVTQLIGSGSGNSKGQYQDIVSQHLQELGIPGIRYLDQGSRDLGEGTSNYVVFDDKIPRIVEILKGGK